MKILQNTKAMLESYDGSMNGLRKSYDDFSYSLDVIMSSMFFIDLEIDRASTPLKIIRGLSTLGYRESFCEKLGIDTTGPYGYTDCTDEAIRQAWVRRKFYADNPRFESYYSWLQETKQDLRIAKELVFEFGLSQGNKNILRMQKSGCGDVKGSQHKPSYNYHIWSKSSRRLHI